jgi:ribosome-associated translation inhibitor RaiA
MRLRIQAPEDLPAQARGAIERRVRLALGRHAAWIERAQVTLAPDLEGRLASRCRIRVRLREGETLEVEERAEDPSSALAAAAWRLEHRMQRRQAAKADGALTSRRVRFR